MIFTVKDGDYYYDFKFLSAAETTSICPVVQVARYQVKFGSVSYFNYRYFELGEFNKVIWNYNYLGNNDFAELIPLAVRNYIDKVYKMKAFQ